MERLVPDTLCFYCHETSIDRSGPPPWSAMCDECKGKYDKPREELTPEELAVIYLPTHSHLQGMVAEAIKGERDYWTKGKHGGAYRAGQIAMRHEASKLAHRLTTKGGIMLPIYAQIDNLPILDEPKEGGT